MSTDSESSVWIRLRERKIVQWSVAYLAGAWVVIEVADVFGQNFGWPDWIFRATTVLLAVGFLAVLVLAWYHGERGRQRVSGMELLMLAGILILAGAALSLVRSDAPGPDERTPMSPEERPEAGLARQAIDASSTIAVLPFDNLSDNPDADPFVRGVHDDLLTQLSMLGALRVISRTSVERYRDADRTIPEIGRELGASWILEAGVQSAGDRIRVNAQLLDAEDDVHVWAESYDLSLTVENVFQIQSDLARKIASALRAEISPDEMVRLRRPPTEDLEAYNAYRTGRHLADRRSAEDLNRAVNYFREAIQLDSTYARAYAGIADAYTQLGTWGLMPRDQAFPDARDAAHNALSFDDQLGEAWASLGYVRYWYEWDWESAEAAFRRAIELSPNYSTGHHWYSLFLVTLGRFEEAEMAIGRAVDLDPLSRIIRTIEGRLHWLAGNVERAVTVHHRAIEIDPGYAVGHMWLGLAYESHGDIEEAVRHLRRAAELDPDGPVLLAGLARAHVLSGRRAQALALMDSLDARGGGRSSIPFWSAVVYTDLGQIDRAFEELDRAYRVRDGWLTEVGISPLLAPLRSDPRYEGLLRRLNLHGEQVVGSTDLEPGSSGLP